MPALHSSQGNGPTKPPLQTHAVVAVLPGGDVLEAGHPSHTALPDASLYVPAPHCAHEPPLGPVKPALQTHAVAAVLPAGDVLEAGHPAHAALPVCSLYVLAAHGVHNLP